MGIKKGLSIDGVNYLSEILSGAKQPGWMDFSSQIAKLTGNNQLLNLMSGITNLEKFLFKTPKWPIGGIYFDGIMRTEHTSRVRATQYPVQTGVVMTDHAIIEPAELTIEIMMSDCATQSFSLGNQFLDFAFQSLKKTQAFSNWIPADKGIPVGNGRSAKTWMLLKAMQLARQPIVVETRLQTYQNMLIEELSAPDDVKTLNALKATIRLREIITANVSETKESARVAAEKQTKGGQIPAKTDAVKDTLLEKVKTAAMRKVIGK